MRGQDNLVRNTADLIETVELENMISQTAQCSGEERHEFTLTNFPKRDDVQWLKHMMRTVACRSEGGADKRGNTGERSDLVSTSMLSRGRTLPGVRCCWKQLPAERCRAIIARDTHLRVTKLSALRNS